MSSDEWEQMVNVLRTSDYEGRAYTRIAIESDESHLPGLYTLIEDENWYTREAAAEALARLEGIRALPQLLQALTKGIKDGQDNDGLCGTIWGVLESDKEKSYALLLPMLQDPSDEVRSNAAWALGFVMEGKESAPLLQALRDNSPAVRGSAAGSLSSFRDNPDVMVALVQALNDEDEQVRVDAAASLGYLGNIQAVPALQALRQDRSEKVRWIAHYSLEQLSKGETVSKKVRRFINTTLQRLAKGETISNG